MELLINIGYFIAGIIISALTLAWKHRRAIAIFIEWLYAAAEDGKISKEELAVLLEAIAKYLKGRT